MARGSKNSDELQLFKPAVEGNESASVSLVSAGTEALTTKGDRRRTTVMLKKKTSDALGKIARRENRTKQGQINFWIEQYYKEQQSSNIELRTAAAKLAAMTSSKVEKESA